MLYYEPTDESYFVGISVLRGLCIQDGQAITRIKKRAYRRNNKPKMGCYAGMQSNGKQEQAKTDQRINQELTKELTKNRQGKSEHIEANGCRVRTQEKGAFYAPLFV